LVHFIEFIDLIVFVIQAFLPARWAAYPYSFMSASAKRGVGNVELTANALCNAWAEPQDELKEFWTPTQTQPPPPVLWLTGTPIRFIESRL
jgi:hypothetical protein